MATELLAVNGLVSRTGLPFRPDLVAAAWSRSSPQVGEDGRGMPDCPGMESSLRSTKDPTYGFRSGLWSASAGRPQAEGAGG
jgi:hypothetical protein